MVFKPFGGARLRVSTSSSAADATALIAVLSKQVCDFLGGGRRGATPGRQGGLLWEGNCCVVPDTSNPAHTHCPLRYMAGLITLTGITP